MIKVAGIRFKEVGKIYYFNPEDLEIEKGQNVIVETVRGVEYGQVAIAPRMVPKEEVHPPLRRVIRLATEEDDRINAENKEKEKDAFGICQEKIKKHKLEMKLIDVEFTFDNNKIIFYFTADGRVDFRDLVKDLASVFRTRIELRQIGVRDEAKMIGGLGTCGRKLCCSSWLGDFDPVSIRMAKDQNLSLNPSKISGICGRLMCCLRYEHETYRYLDKQLPKVGKKIETLKGPGVVISKNLMTQSVRVLVQGERERDREVFTIEKDRIEDPRGDQPREIERTPSFDEAFPPIPKRWEPAPRKDRDSQKDRRPKEEQKDRKPKEDRKDQKKETASKPKSKRRKRRRRKKSGGASQGGDAAKNKASDGQKNAGGNQKPSRKPDGKKTSGGQREKQGQDKTPDKSGGKASRNKSQNNSRNKSKSKPQGDSRNKQRNKSGKNPDRKKNTPKTGNNEKGDRPHSRGGEGK